DEDNVKKIEAELEESNNVKETEYNIVLEDENKENEKIIAIDRTHNHLIRINKRE
ncbi:4511_t:CDS:1, partial [Dentiscutata heterogama]